MRSRIFRSILLTIVLEFFVQESFADDSKKLETAPAASSSSIQQQRVDRKLLREYPTYSKNSDLIGGALIIGPVSKPNANEYEYSVYYIDGIPGVIRRNKTTSCGRVTPKLTIP